LFFYADHSLNGDMGWYGELEIAGVKVQSVLEKQAGEFLTERTRTRSVYLNPLIEDINQEFAYWVTTEYNQRTEFWQ